jgi:hypothetical protein
LAHLLEVALDGGIRGAIVLHCIAEGEVGKSAIDTCFDGCKPSRRDWVTSKSMVETNKSADAGEVYALVA